jgi:hypothetical protein
MKGKLFTALILSAVFSATVQASGLKTYEVTISNATHKHVLTPPLLVTHNRHFSLFSVGGTASDGLAVQAETGNPGPVSLEVSNAAGVKDVVTGSGPILYGQSATFQITAKKRDRITITSMLATTNDSFAGLNSVALPKHSAQYFAYAYDAGSELNNELCSHIPGPPCAGDSGNARTENGEGYISISRGVNGIGDLSAVHLDWRGPVAVITIKRIND